MFATCRFSSSVVRSSCTRRAGAPIVAANARVYRARPAIRPNCGAADNGFLRLVGTGRVGPCVVGFNMVGPRGFALWRRRVSCFAVGGALSCRRSRCVLLLPSWAAAVPARCGVRRASESVRFWFRRFCRRRRRVVRFCRRRRRCGVSPWRCPVVLGCAVASCRLRCRVRWFCAPALRWDGCRCDWLWRFRCGGVAFAASSFFYAQ